MMPFCAIIAVMGTLNMGTPSSYFTKPPLPTMPIMADNAQRSCL